NNSAIIGVIDINQGEKIGSSGSIDIYEKDDSQGLNEEPNVHLKVHEIRWAEWAQK
ncbi:16182_t:CDS:2, partial [Entrophospora sp. SA101]